MTSQETGWCRPTGPSPSPCRSRRAGRTKCTSAPLARLRPTRHLTLDEQRDLGLALQEFVRRYDWLFGFELPYMMVVHEAPRGPTGRHRLAPVFEFWPPHRSADKLKVRASVETSTGLFINDALPEASAELLAGLRDPMLAAPVVPQVVLDDVG